MPIDPAVDAMNPKNIVIILGEMDSDCAARTVMAAILGKEKFMSQMVLECGIMSQRTAARKTQPSATPELDTGDTDPNISNSIEFLDSEILEDAE